MSSEVSLAIIAICFICLILVGLIVVIFLIRFLKNVNRKVSTLEYQIQPLLSGSEKIINTAHEFTAKLKYHLDQTEPLFSTISKTGLLMEHFIGKMQKEAENPKIIAITTNNQKKIDLEDWIEWLSIGLVLWQKIKKRIER